MVLAGAYLRPLAANRPHETAATEHGQHIDAAATALTAAHDLLRMHTATTINGRFYERSSWAPILTTPTFHRAVTAEGQTLDQARRGRSMCRKSFIRSRHDLSI